MKQTINLKEANCLSLVYFFSGLACIGTYNFTGRNAWLALLLAAAFGAVFILLYYKAAAVLEKSRLFIILLALLAIGLIGFYVKLITQFLITCVLPNTSPYHTGGLILLFAAWFGYKGLQSIGRFCRLIVPILTALLILLLIIPLACIDLFYVDSLLQMPDISLILQNGLMFKDNHFILSLLFFSATYLLKGIVLVSLFRLSKNCDFNSYPAIKNGIFITAPILALIMLSAVLSLGPAVYDMLSYPVYYPLSLIESGEYILHFEIIFLIIYIFSELVQLGVLFLYVKLALRRVFTNSW